MSFQSICDALGVSPDGDLEAAFRQLFYCHPRTSCEPIQLTNLLLPLVVDLLRTHFGQSDMVTINLYLFSEVSFSLSCYHNFNMLFIVL